MNIMMKWYQGLPDYVRSFFKLAVIVFLMCIFVWFI